MKSRLRLPTLLALSAILFAFPPAAAQYQDQDRYDDDDGIRQSVARVSWFQGDVSFSRGDAPDDWEPASTNYPMTLGDRLWSGRNARVELQLRGATVFLGSETELTALDLTRDVRQLSLNLGTASFRISRLGRDEVFEVATPNVSVTFATPGLYRIDVDEDGNSRVSVRQGQAWAAAAGGQVELARGELIRVWGTDNPDYDVVALARIDSWDRWVDQRVRRYRSVRSASYVHPDIYGAYDLDAYGSWQTHAEYGSVWYPRGVSAGWEPYRSGRWIWRDPWGWTWLSSEPWGWAPYHYGRWAVIRGRWGWVPVGPSSRYPGYSPAIVGFVGGGSGVSFSVSVGGFVGWFPLGPREPFDPWWHRSRSNVNVAGYNYAYRSRVTVVARNTFVGSGWVDRAVVRDPSVMREVSTAPVLRGPIPVLPTRDSIRVRQVGVQGRASVRPPERVGQREVVTRTAPPPAPPTFERKLEVIRESGGAPVQTDVSRRLAVEERRGEKAARPVRPAAREKVLLAPRGQVKESRKPQPLPPSATRAPETRAAPAPVREALPPAREPEVRRASEPARPAAEPPKVVPEAKPGRAPTPPRRIDNPAAPPDRGRATAPAPELKREEAPPKAVPEPKNGRRPISKPPDRTADRPTPVPASRAVRAPEAGPRLERTDVKPAPARPGRVELKKAEPGKAAPTVVEPARGNERGNAKPTATPKKGKNSRTDREKDGRKDD
jgi:hypothetical protein